MRKLGIKNTGNPSQKKSKQGGWVLIEFVAVAVAVAGLAAFVASRMGESNAEREINDVKTTITAGSQKIRDRYESWGNYGNLSNKSCYQGKIFPPSWLSATADQFNTPFTDNGIVCGSVDTATDLDGFTTTGTGKYFTIALSGLDAAQCNNVVNSLIRSFVEVQVGGTRIDSDLAVETNCVENSTVTLIGK